MLVNRIAEDTLAIGREISCLVSLKVGGSGCIEIQIGHLRRWAATSHLPDVDMERYTRVAVWIGDGRVRERRNDRI